MILAFMGGPEGTAGVQRVRHGLASSLHLWVLILKVLGLH